jgi:hypothetical protein
VWLMHTADAVLDVKCQELMGKRDPFSCHFVSFVFLSRLLLLCLLLLLHTCVRHEFDFKAYIACDPLATCGACYTRFE